MRIVISGTVGIGKSTTSELLTEELKNKGFNVSFLGEETVNSIYLEYYYKSPQDWAFVAQLDFLLGRFKQWLVDEKRQSKLTSKEKTTDFTIYDRHFLDDYVFAELHTIKENISMFNSITYQAIYKELTDKMAKLDARPDYFFLLKASLPTVMERLDGRGREVETETPMDYWKDLYHNYYDRPMFQNHFQQNSKHFVEINTENKEPKEIVKEILAIILD